MKYKYEIGMALLWACAILTTLWITRGTDFFNYLGPLFFICMTGSIIIVKLARSLSPKSRNLPGE
jgi:uncharacterized membrane protein